MASLRAIKNHIIFRFEDETVVKTDGNQRRSQFKETTSWGFEISSYDEGLKSARWGTVVSSGPDVIDPEIKPGVKILIEPLQWSTVLELDDGTYWRTDESKVLCIEEDI